MNGLCEIAQQQKSWLNKKYANDEAAPLCVNECGSTRGHINASKYRTKSKLGDFVELERFWKRTATWPRIASVALKASCGMSLSLLMSPL